MHKSSDVQYSAGLFSDGKISILSLGLKSGFTCLTRCLEHTIYTHTTHARTHARTHTHTHTLSLSLVTLHLNLCFLSISSVAESARREAKREGDATGGIQVGQEYVIESLEAVVCTNQATCSIQQDYSQMAK